MRRRAQRVGCWIPPIQAPLDGGKFNFLQSGTNSLVIDASGTPHIAYFSGALGLHYGTWPTAVPNFWAWSSFGSGESVDTAAGPSPAKILLDPNNAVHIAYQGQVPAQTQGGTPTTELGYATRASVDNWATSTVDPSINCGSGISAAMSPSGWPHIAYGFTPVVNASTELKHTYLMSWSPVRIPPPHKKRTILVLPS